MIAAIAGDPGGANALAPVIVRLLATGRRVRLFGYRQAKPLWESRGWAVQTMPDGANVSTIADELADAHALLTATSANGVDLEKRFIAAARQLGMPTLAVLDFWSAYRERFSDGTGRLAYLPDRIAVPDVLARDEIVSVGISADLVTITGQPAFDELAAFRIAFTDETRAACRQRWGCSDHEKAVVFFSQPVLPLTPPGHPRFPGYCEEQVLRLVADACDEAAQECGASVALVLRPHPRENPADVARYVPRRAGRVVVETAGDRREAILAADLVAGMATVVLVEACLLGCAAVSVQPSLCLPDAIPTNRSGATQAVYDPAAVGPTFVALLSNPTARREAELAAGRFRHEPGASERVIAVLDGLLAARFAITGAAT